MDIISGQIRSEFYRHARREHGRLHYGFTIIEVLVVVSIIALLVSILLPSLASARHATRSSVCLSQLRQMAIAAQAYTSTFHGSYPPNLDTVYTPEFDSMTFTRKVEYAWDFSRVSDGPTADARIVPGLIWQGRMPPQIQQCPSFDGAAMWADDRYTGYNYNSSYIGAFLKKKRKSTTATGTTTYSWEIAVKPAKQDQIRRAGQCAVFGDGEYAGGANKFMRSPWGAEKGARDYWVSSERGAGMQGYRHQKRTNVAFADGHGESRIQRHVQTYEYLKGNIPDNVGFLSADNSMYALDPDGDRRASSQMTP